MKKLKHLGGQAVIEGVMIQAPDNVSVAVRNQHGKIVSKREKRKSLTKKYKFLKLPIFRGCVLLIEQLVTGVKALTWSANQQGEEEELGPLEWFITFTMAIGLTIVLFVLAPYYGSKLLYAPETVQFAVLDGVLRLLVFLLYVWVIGLMKDVRRMFMYHGAEHMAVHCYEAKKKLTVKNVAKYPPEHPRCGTSFLFIVVIVSIFVFSFIRTPHWYINVPARIVLVPFVAGLSFEILKVSAKYKWLRWVALPGLWVQKLTTRKPTADQIQVAIAAVNKAKR